MSIKGSSFGFLVRSAGLLHLVSVEEAVRASSHAGIWVVTVFLLVVQSKKMGEDGHRTMDAVKGPAILCHFLLSSTSGSLENTGKLRFFSPWCLHIVGTH